MTKFQIIQIIPAPMQNTIVSLTVFRYFIFAGKSITFKRNYSGHSSSSNKRPTKRSINADFSHKSCFSMWAHDSRLWDKVLTLEMFSSPPNVHQQIRAQLRPLTINCSTLNHQERPFLRHRFRGDSCPYLPLICHRS